MPLPHVCARRNPFAAGMAVTLHMRMSDTQQAAPTTRTPWGAGDPRLVVSGDGVHRQVVLDGDVTRIGSAEDAGIRLHGLEPLAGEIVHADNDDYVFLTSDPDADDGRYEPGRVAVPPVGEVLRPGARFTLGNWTFIYLRDGDRAVD